MGICQQKGYADLEDYKSKKNFQKYFEQQEKKKKEQSMRFQKYFQEQEKKKKEQSMRFQKYFEQEEKKKKEQSMRFQKFFQEQEKMKKAAKKPNQTQMAKVFYAYCRVYGSNPKYNTDVQKFIEENYNPNYRSQTYKLNTSSPLITYKSDLIDRFMTAHNSNLITFHQHFRKADQQKRTLQYEWIIRNQSTNYMWVYDCQATFDEKNRFLTLTLRQNDRMNHKPSPPLPKVEQKREIYDSPKNNYYGPPPTDWGAYYDAQAKASQAQLRQNLNRQAEDWNNYVRQKNARGW